MGTATERESFLKGLFDGVLSELDSLKEISRYQDYSRLSELDSLTKKDKEKGRRNEGSNRVAVGAVGDVGDVGAVGAAVGMLHAVSLIDKSCHESLLLLLRQYESSRVVEHRKHLDLNPNLNLTSKPQT